MQFNVFDFIFSIIFTAIFVFGYILTNNDAFELTISKPESIVYILTSIVLFFAIYFGLSVVRNLINNNKQTSKSRVIFLKNIPDSKLWVMISIFIFLCYIPIILLSSSELTYDSWNIIAQSTGQLPLTNAHPVIFTAFVSIFTKLGIAVGNINLGITMFTFVQSAILSVIFGKITIWQRRIGMRTYGVLATLLFYTILPINSFAGTVFWKDILFAGFGLLLLQKILQLQIEKNSFFTKKNILLFIVYGFLFSILRNNGLYAYILFFVCIILLNRKAFFNKKHLLLLFSPVLLAVLYLLPVTLTVGPASSVESLSVPLQQISRTVKYHSASMSDADKEIINEIFPYSELGERYNPGLSDPIKWVFNKSAFDNNKSKYIGEWIKLSYKYPKTYIAAFMYNTYGYLYPFKDSSTTTDLVINNADQINAFSGYSDSSYQWGGKKVLTKYRDVISSTLPQIRNIGFYSCVILFALYISLIMKNRSLDGVFFLLMSLFITVILGPVNGEFRYLYLFVIALPLIYSALFSKIKIKPKE